MKFAICDHHIEDSKILKQALLTYMELHDIEIDIDVYHQKADVLESPDRYDCYFIDLDIEKENGLRLAEAVRAKDKRALFIMVSNYLDFALDAYRVTTFRYLMKPFDKNILMETFHDLFKAFAEFTFSIKDENNCIHHVYLHDILYIETFRKETVLYLVNKEIHTKYTLNEVLDILQSDFLVTCFRGIVVNISNIDMISGNMLVLRNKRTLQASRNYINDIMLKFFLYVDVL